MLQLCFGPLFCIQKMYQENNTDYQLVTKLKLHDTKIQTFRTKLHHTNFTDKNKFFTYLHWYLRFSLYLCGKNDP